MDLICKRINAAQGWKKMYVQRRHMKLKSMVDDMVFMSILPYWIGSSKKLEVREVKPFLILNRVGELAYGTEHPRWLVGVHNIFRNHSCESVYKLQLP